MSDEHAELGSWVAAYALGALDPDDRRRFERHRDDCPLCQAELAALAPIPSMLSRLTGDQVAAPTWIAGPTPGAVPGLDTEAVIGAAAAGHHRRLLVSRRRWRRIAAASIAATVLLLGLAAGQLVSRSPSSRPVVAAMIDESQLASARITTSERGWGTEVGLELTGLPLRPRYQLWAVERNGQWTPVASWGPTKTGRTRLTGATSVATSEVDRLVVTSDDDRDVLVSATVRQQA